MINEINREPVRLRSRSIKGGESLFLDICNQGRRQREYLKLYIMEGTSREIKQHNKDVILLANAIKSQRVIEIQSGKFQFTEVKYKNLSLIDFLEMQRDEYVKKGREQFSRTIRNVKGHIKSYSGEKVRLRNVSKNFVAGYISYLYKAKSPTGNPLAQKTICLYYNVFSILLNKAVNEGYLKANPCNQIPIGDKPKNCEAYREYLTLNEIKLLTNTECRDNRVKRLFLFCCFTGLRYSDAIKLTWEDIAILKEGSYQIETVQQKTKETVYIPLSRNAIKFLPCEIAPENTGIIFDMPERSCAYDILHEWTKKADITKNVTFHVARHTYATLLLFYGADIYTVSKLLGHQSIKTTEIYAKVVDETKRKAVELIPSIVVP